MLREFNPTRLRAVSIILVSLSLLGMVIVPKPLRSASAAAPQPTALPFTDVNPLGATFFLEREVEPWKREQTIKMAKEAGIGWIKQMFSWEEIEPQKDYFFDDKFKKSSWQKYDEIVDLSEKYGIRIIARLDRPPAWTRKDNRYPTAPPDNFEDYARYVKTVVARYKGRIQHYQIWNEPNIWPEWGDQAVDPPAYAAMLRAAFKAAKSADPDVVVLSAPLAQTLEESSRNMSELKYLDALYKAGARDYFDVQLANAYGFGMPPDAPPDPNALNFSRLKLLREVMERNGDGNKTIWLNEFGWNATPQDFPAHNAYWGRVTEEQQAAYTTQAIQLARSWGWIGVLNTWYFRQVGDIPVDKSEYFFRIVDVDFTPRPIFHALKEVGQQMAVAPPGTHEEMNGGVAASPGWRGSFQLSASGTRVLVSPEDGGRVTFTFDGSELTMNVLTGKAPAGIDVIVDGKDRKTAEIPGSDAPQFQPVTLVKNLMPGIHSVEVGHKSGPAVTFDSFTVANNPNPIPFWGVLSILLLGIAGLVASFLVRRRKSVTT